MAYAVLCTVNHFNKTMKTSNKDLRSAIERNEILYMSAESYEVKKQVWQNLVYLRSLLKTTNSKRSKN